MSNNYHNDQTNMEHFPQPSKADYLGKQKPNSGYIGLSGKNKGKSIGLTGDSKGITANTVGKNPGYDPNNAS